MELDRINASSSSWLIFQWDVHLSLKTQRIKNTILIIRQFLIKINKLSLHLSLSNDCDMRNPENQKEITELLRNGKELTAADFFAACPGIPAATVYSRIRALLQRGELTQTGRGRYISIRKPTYQIIVTSWMREVNDYLIGQCESVNHCISQREDNLLVEVPRMELSRVEICLKENFHKVVLKKDADRFPAPLEGYIIVGPLVSDAPVSDSAGVPVPSLEKEMVDSLSRAGKKGRRKKLDFQRLLEVYPVNIDRMHRYAERRGVEEELDSVLSSLDNGRMETISAVQRYFSHTQAVTRVWVFGSFARREETEESDLDLLVDYDPLITISLLDIIRQKLDLEELIGREVDLIQNGNLKPFAIPSAEKDKYLIYER